MVRMMGQTFLGLLFFAAGIYCMYLYLTGLDLGGNPLLIALSPFLLGGGVFLLLSAGKSDATVVKTVHEDIKEDTNQSAQTKEGFETVIQKNNAMTAQWEKTT